MLEQDWELRKLCGPREPEKLVWTWQKPSTNDFLSRTFRCSALLQSYHGDDRPDCLVQHNHTLGSCVGHQYSSQAVWQYWHVIGSMWSGCQLESPLLLGALLGLSTLLPLACHPLSVLCRLGLLLLFLLCCLQSIRSLLFQLSKTAPNHILPSKS